MMKLKGGTFDVISSGLVELGVRLYSKHKEDKYCGMAMIMTTSLIVLAGYLWYTMFCTVVLVAAGWD